MFVNWENGENGRLGRDIAYYMPFKENFNVLFYFNGAEIMETETACEQMIYGIGSKALGWLKA